MRRTSGVAKGMAFCGWARIFLSLRCDSVRLTGGYVDDISPRVMERERMYSRCENCDDYWGLVFADEGKY